MKRFRHKILVFILSFSLLWMGMPPAFASFGDTCCGHHSASDSRMNDPSGLLPIKNRSCDCGGGHSRTACSDRSVGQISFMGHPIMNKAASLAQLLSDLFDGLIPGVAITGAKPPCCDIDKAPMSTTHGAPPYCTPSRSDNVLFVALSKISTWLEGPSELNYRPFYISLDMAGASLTRVYLDNSAFLI